MNQLTKNELMELILSVHAIHTDYGTEKTEFDNQIDDIFNEITNKYDYDEYWKKQQKEDTKKLLTKLLSNLNEMAAN